MKFFEFNDYEYYALIVADGEEKAVLGYEETVAEIFDEEKELSPTVITVEKALKRYKRGMIEGCETTGEKIQDFYKTIDNFKEYVSKGTEYLVLLIDGRLI